MNCILCFLKQKEILICLGVITLFFIEKCISLLSRDNKALNKVEDIKDSFNMDLIRSEAIKQAESESRIELINKLKEEKKKKLKINTI